MQVLLCVRLVAEITSRKHKDLNLRYKSQLHVLYPPLCPVTNCRFLNDKGERAFDKGGATITVWSPICRFESEEEWSKVHVPLLSSQEAGLLFYSSHVLQ